MAMSAHELEIPRWNPEATGERRKMENGNGQLWGAGLGDGADWWGGCVFLSCYQAYRIIYELQTHIII